MQELLFDVFVAGAVGCFVWAVLLHFDVVGYIRFYARFWWNKLTYKPRPARAKVILRGKPGTILHLDDFRVRDAKGRTHVSVSSGRAVMPESGALEVATIEEKRS